MVFGNPSWPCAICGERREQQFLDLNIREVVAADGNKIRYEIRYCNDKSNCRQVAAERVAKWLKGVEK